MESKMKYFSLHPYVGIIQIRFRVSSQLGCYQAPRAFVLTNIQLSIKPHNKFSLICFDVCVSFWVAANDVPLLQRVWD